MDFREEYHLLPSHSDFSWFLEVSHGLEHLVYLVEERGHPALTMQSPAESQPRPGHAENDPFPGMFSQDPVAGQVISELFTNRKENINLRFSEDCLYLNIYTPADLRRRSRLPVSNGNKWSRLV
ncbi:putative inactive carboxylesterase 4 isoform X2 [Delphinapterus leucas]|uniref:Inactive carboxylesterase 4 isoform X2 n=1 Tax=Delphinapterus leucas TaxID=9749 RepID=A0A7F8KCM7_DELLE|nr:putative inactive carboxylesterase 4 isoform X2 [Delphinapterus leucas]